MLTFGSDAMMPRRITLLVLSLVLYSSLISMGDAVQLSSSRLDPGASEHEIDSLLLRQLKRGHREAAAGNPLYSNDWAVQVYGGEEPANELAALHGFINIGKIGNLDDHYHFQLNVNVTFGSSEGQSGAQSKTLDQLSDINNIGQRGEITRALSNSPKVGFVEQQKLHTNYHRTAYNYTYPTDPKFYKQWSLLNTGRVSGAPYSGKDLNVEPAWMQGITGKGVVVSVFDDGLEWTHPDIRPNYDSSASYDYIHYDSNPSPDNYYGDEADEHGTSCAGEIAMVKDNGRCGVGVAYESSLGALKFNVSRGSDITESLGLGHMNNYIKVYSNSWGPSDFGFNVGGPGRLTKQTLFNGATRGRNGKGVIYVFASGNGGGWYDSCAADGYVASIYTIAVGSANSYGGQADYDEQCAGKMAVTFSYNSRTFPSSSDSWDAYNQVTTTKLLRGCTDGFTGTSASTPLVSGVATLVLQANPSLTWRDVQYLIAYTSNRDSLSSGVWSTNGAGLRVSHKFGFGAIDAEAMVTRAKRWINVPPQHNVTVSPSPSSGTSRRYSSLTQHFTVSNSSSRGISFLEHVVVTMSLRVRGYTRSYNYSDLTDALSYITTYAELYRWLEDSHPRRGDIKILLTSPQGTTSTLLPYRNYDFINVEGYSSWPFMSVHHWGENPVGRWTLTISFKSSSGYVSVSGVHMTLFGTTTTPQAVANIPSMCDSECARYCSGRGPDHCDACRHLRVAATLQCVTSCPRGTTLHNKYCLGNVTQSTEAPTTVSSTDAISTDKPTTNRPPSPRTTHAPPTTAEHKISTYKPFTHSPSSPPTTATPTTVKSHMTNEEHHHHSTQSSEGVTTTTQNEQTTTDADANTDSSSGGQQHGRGVAMIAGVSVTVVVLVVLAAAVVTAVVVYLVRKKMGPQSRGFTKLSMTNMEKNAVDV